MKTRNIYLTIVLPVLLVVLVTGAFAQEVHSGQYAARIEWTQAWQGGDDTGLDRQENMLPVTGGHQVTFKAWVKNGVPGGDNTFRVTFADFDASETWLGDDPKTGNTPTDEWIEYSFSHSSDAGATQMNVAFRMERDNGAAIVIDDISLYDDTASTPIVVSNPGFEDWPGTANTAPTDWRFFSVPEGEGVITRIEALPPVLAVKPENWEIYH